MAIGVVSRVSPAVFNRTITEGYLTQPNLMLGAHAGGVSFASTFNFEGYTLKRGELNPGMYGEGYIDRRHPHTIVHEAMLSYSAPSIRGVRWSLAGGKGFTPYGSDDPMMRPFVLFPVNHHHAQIIERVQVLGALRVGSDAHYAALEHAFFNGDEPVGPFIAPQYKRVGDSRTTRLSLQPWRGVEWQASRAFIRSPGIVQGGAFDHTQTSLSLRIDRDGAPDMDGMNMSAMSAHQHSSTPSTRRYLLLEVARTDEGFGTRRAFRYTSALGEALWMHRGWALAARLERTERPENERLLDPFRIANGHIDFQIIGVTRWSTATLHVDGPAMPAPSGWRTHVTPFVEVATAQAKALRLPAVFIPAEFYGRSTLVTLSVGVRAHAGTMRDRMGRYGVLRSLGAHTM